VAASAEREKEGGREGGGEEKGKICTKFSLKLP
jgi:hypothetical protein